MTTTATTHRCQLTRTNSYGVVAVCACGWYGVVHPSYRHVPPRAVRGRREYGNAEAKAIAEYEDHVRDDGPLRVTLAPEQFVGTVINTKRFGHA